MMCSCISASGAGDRVAMYGIMKIKTAVIFRSTTPISFGKHLTGNSINIQHDNDPKNNAVKGHCRNTHRAYWSWIGLPTVWISIILKQLAKKKLRLS